MLLTHIRLVVNDFGTVFRFYRDVVGLMPQADDVRGPYAKFSLPRGDAAIALQARAHVEAAVGPLGTGASLLVALRVDSLDDTVAALRARGASVVPAAVQWGSMRVAHLRDPEGRVLEFQEWLARAT